MNKYRDMPIEECGEPMVAIPKGLFVLVDPHPYVKAGAPYGDATPWMLRKNVLKALKKAQDELQKRKPGWKLLLTDAYRPNRVQVFMVRAEFRKLAREKGFTMKQLTLGEDQNLAPSVYRLWARASDDPKTPAPHSTGAVVDVTFVDKRGRKINMGSPVDENSERSNPNHFIESNPLVHRRRELLNEIMVLAGFRRANDEYWHFGRRDQFMAYYQKEAGNPNAAARYGRADLLPQYRL